MPFDRDSIKQSAADLAAKGVFIGTSSWKYQGWLGQLYTPTRYEYRGKVANTRFERDCLAEYAQVFKTVCVDAAYYDFPRPEYLKKLADQVPDDFLFGFKVTDAVTVKKFPNLPRFGAKAGQPNPDFLNADLFASAFLKPCQEIRPKIGVLMFEFSRFWPTDYEYLTASDPAFVERTWQVVMEQLQSRGKDSSRERYKTVFKSASFDALRQKKLLETTADDFFAVFKDGKVSIVYFLKRLHNFALSLGWIALPVVAPYLWPKYEAKDRRGITPDEQQSILALEKKAEWKLFLELLWETGAAQGDAAAMTAEDVDWQSRTITYFRAKTGSRAQFTISKALETVLSHLPTTGPLFPNLSQFTANDRASRFRRRCERASVSGVTLHSYDAILIDEAQDFSPHFLLLCYEFLKEPKRLVYAYDELQNLGKKSLPPMEDIFGKTADGTPRVKLHPDEPGKPKQDIILDVCYRNSRPVLSTAHALGFGIYRDKGIVQIFENKELWLDIGYEVKSGRLEDGEPVILGRTPKSSPAFLENHSSVDDLIGFNIFNTPQEQTAWLVDAITRNLNEDELLPDDIVVINPDPIATRDAVKDARSLLMERGINSNLAGVTSSVDIFTEPGTVTFTGIFRAKGNEAAMVYVMNAQDCFTSFLPGDVSRVRNRLFTAITRSKAWVRVLGVGRGMTALKTEFDKTKAAHFELNFTYPTEEQRKQMTIVNRDMSKAEQDRFAKKRGSLLDIIESLESGETFIEDYPEDIIKKLQRLLNKKTK